MRPGGESGNRKSCMHRFGRQHRPRQTLRVTYRTGRGVKIFRNDLLSKTPGSVLSFTSQSFLSALRVFLDTRSHVAWTSQPAPKARQMVARGKRFAPPLDWFATNLRALEGRQNDR